MSRERLKAAGLAASFGGLLSCLIFAGQAHSTESTESMKPVEDLVELDEVKVRGKIVANAVITAESRLFRLYNRLNEDNRYDVHCHDVRAGQRLALLRTCIPEFLSRQAASIFYPPSLRTRTTFFQCGMPTTGFDANGDVYYQGSCLGSVSSRNIYANSPTYFEGAGLPSNARRSISVPAERVSEFKQTMASVMSSDPELYEMAVALAGMYQEVERVEARYAELQEERRAAQKARREAARASGRNLRPPHPRAP